MALYALDEDDLISASDATPGKIYWCADCFGPVKKRQKRSHLAHFYHLKTSPSCRLYSKSEDHLVAQVELQKRFPKGEIQIEKPFAQISRIADACLEKEKIIFEIQCSPMSEKEAEMRFSDYGSLGYDVVFLLDDKRYNRRFLRPEEKYLRQRGAYFLSIRRSLVYDQFEIFSDGRRVKRGKMFPLDLSKVLFAPKRPFSEEFFPKQITQLKVRRHFYGDALSHALRFPQAMVHQRSLERSLAKALKGPNLILRAIQKYIIRPYLHLLEKILKSR